MENTSPWDRTFEDHSLKSAMVCMVRQVVRALPFHRREVEVLDPLKEKAAEVLEALVQEMEDRYRAFAKARARDLPTYNSKVSPEERLLKLQDFVKFLTEIRAAGKKAGLGR